MTTSRRDLLSGMMAFCVATAAARSLASAQETALRLGEPEPFSPDLVREQARALAAEPFGTLDATLPEVLAELDDNQQRDIRFRPEMALWHGLGLDAEVQFFHLGYHFNIPVHIYDVADGMAREVLYAPALFDFGDNGFEAAEFPSDLGFAGFRLHAPLNRPDYLDEFAVFLGASYFRAVGRGQRYGISARGVAIDTGLPKQEEFPAFRRVWLERPAPGTDQIVMHALLDGPSLTGAYTFKIQPGDATLMEIDATLYPRQAIELLGVAPLTSMFLFGPNDRRGVDDFRPEVHDSDGLQIWSGTGDWLWRPLVNPDALRLSLFSDNGPKGFGLMQRTREFEAYEDLDAQYGLRPSLWVEPLEGWGQGHVRLIEIPSPAEVHDNIVAFWAPRAPVEAGSEWRFRYRLYWGREAPVRPELAQTAATRIGGGGPPGQPKEGDVRRFVIDFTGGQLKDLPANAPVEAAVTVAKGELTLPITRKNEVTGGWRVMFDLYPAGSEPVELRCALRLGDKALSETWVYQWTA